MTEETITLKTIAKMIDHSLLHPTMTDAIITDGIALARRFDVATVCVKPYSTRMAAEMLAGSDVGVCAVIAFPHGNSTTDLKLAETQQVLDDGATEVDMVVNIGKVLGVVENHAILKVIFETDYLQDEHIIRLCQICSEHGAAFVKTSTGYGFVKQPNGLYSYQGATEHNLRLMRQYSAPEVQIKAAGGVRSLDDLLKVRALGVSRIGATATEAILTEARQRGYTA